MNLTESEKAALRAPKPTRTKHERLLDASLKLVEIVEGAGAPRWADSGTVRRLKDTPEWVEFYLAANPFRR